MILDSKRNSSPRPAHARVGVLTAAAALAALFVLHAGPRLVLAGQSNAGTSQAASVEPGAESPLAPLEITVEPPPDLLAAVDDTPSAPTPDRESGARPKPRPAAELRFDGPAALPAPPAAPLAVPPRVPGVPPVAARTPSVPRLALAPPGERAESSKAAAVAQRPRGPADSIERRLERLEQLVESLLAREKGPKRQAETKHEFNFDWDWKGPKFDFDTEKFGKLAEEHKRLFEKMHKFGPNEQELARIKEQAKQHAERAGRDAERAAREIDRAAREMKERHDQAEPARSPREGLERQRQSLEAHRKSLERQVESLQRQIRRLDEEQQKVEPKRAPREKSVEPGQEGDGPKRAAPREDGEPKSKR